MLIPAQLMMNLIRYLIANIRIFPALFALVTFSVSPLAGASTYTVTSIAGPGSCTADSTTDLTCTLAAAIAAASNYDTVLFAPDVQGQTISGSYDLAKSLTIDASPNGVVLDGGGVGRILFVEASVASVNLSHITLQHGSASDGGGIYVDAHGTLNLDRCTVAHNTASTNGGGIYNNGYLWIKDSTLYDNAAQNGGGIYNPAPFGSVVLVNSTIAANSASTQGGGIDSSSAVVLRSDIVAGNDAPSAPDIANPLVISFSLTSYGNNLIGDGTGTNFTGSLPSDHVGTGVAPIDPLFSTEGLTDNGGATPTVALQSASPARIVGACSSNSGPPHIDPSEFDQRDVPRSTPCTIGAFDMTAIFYGGFDG
jgi:predicted outer membrane repeat protein